MKKIALVGTCPSGKEAPFDDESWEIWGVGSRADYVTRATRWFEIHAIDNEEPDFQVNWRAYLKRWFKDGKTEIWMIYPEYDLGNVVQYPAKEISIKYGTYFLTSTFAWMMALALDEGVDEIALYGIDMEYGEEYREQRNGLRHFIELAKQLNVNVTRLFTSGIAYEPVPYPMFCNDPLIQKLKWRKGVNDGNLAAFEATLEVIENSIIRANGAIDEAKEAQKKKYDSKDRINRTKKQIALWEDDVENLKRHIGNGAFLKKEHEWFLDYLIP